LLNNRHPLANLRCRKRRATLTRRRRVVWACQSSLQAWVAIARHSPAKGAAAEAIRVVA
jgi:hypothetical protein